MSTRFSQLRKMDPTKGAQLPGRSPNNNDRIEIGPSQLAYREWEEADLTPASLPRMRDFRLKRKTWGIVGRGWGGLLLFDPLNIRYATDATNMQIWNTHNQFRAVLVCAGGHMVVWGYSCSKLLLEHNRLVCEVRSGAGMFYISTGDKSVEQANRFIGEIMREHAGSNRPLGVDKILLQRLCAVERAGFEIEDGEECTEKTRAIKDPDEIHAMRCAHHTCEESVAAKEKACRKGVQRGDMSENDVWAVLHGENIKRGGEWIETRLLTSGPRTNPWYRECRQRIIQNTEIVAFDTGLIGNYGICIDISRTWWVGDGKPMNAMVYAMRQAHEHVMTNMGMPKPCVSFTELVFCGHKLDARFEAQKYGCKMHGVGLCDEWPCIDHPDKWVEGAFDGVVQPGMVLCVEALVATEGGSFSSKLEDQVPITETGHENLTRYPFDPRLLGETYTTLPQIDEACVSESCTQSDRCIVKRRPLPWCTSHWHTKISTKLKTPPPVLARSV
ncbi:Xaa-Pro peptidase family protein [Ruegeria sp. WL0004]|uniref:Xaa-Pro peptidase family protein n=1 Tax=Ruegeria marisflavi TaxID=2984152 RepID=A0ABT2WXB8_9RHOB|nr:dimethylsulfonioproprionate lyase DddP [Ruegeria sp. WL0004]MCU9840545.1 Xaa-Pro peptidase family protein [Ruegeria sp. WL0004]